MVKLTAPLMAQEASGKLGKALIYSRAGVRNYAKRYRKPSQPQSTLQLSNRALVAWLTTRWATLSTAAQSSWWEHAERWSLSKYHAYLRYNCRRFQAGEAPTTRFPPDTTGFTGRPDYDTATGGVHMATYKTHLRVDDGTWGFELHRSQTPGDVSDKTNVITIQPYHPTDYYTYWVDSPLPPGTYYYRNRCQSVYGLYGAFFPWKTAVVT